MEVEGLCDFFVLKCRPRIVVVICPNPKKFGGPKFFWNIAHDVEDD